MTCRELIIELIEKVPLDVEVYVPSNVGKGKCSLSKRVNFFENLNQAYIDSEDSVWCDQG